MEYTVQQSTHGLSTVYQMDGINILIANVVESLGEVNKLKRKEKSQGYCKTCGKVYANIHQHKVIHRVDRERKYKCDLCNKSYLTKQGLVVHNEIHLPQKSFSCETCHVSFQKSYELKKHNEEIHQKAPEKLYLCSTCGMKFSQKSKFIRHSYKHDGIRPFKCKFCGKAFTYENVLNDHVRIHTGAKPYKCATCGKCFSQSSNLRSHIRFVHEGEKSKQCPKCDHKSTTTGDLKRHMRRAHRDPNSAINEVLERFEKIKKHGPRQLECSLCGRKYIGRNGLRRHMQSHEDGSFSCDICRQHFDSEKSLQKHLKRFDKKVPIHCEYCGNMYHTEGMAKKHFLNHIRDGVLGSDEAFGPIIIEILQDESKSRGLDSAERVDDNMKSLDEVSSENHSLKFCITVNYDIEYEESDENDTVNDLKDGVDCVISDENESLNLASEGLNEIIHSGAEILHNLPNCVMPESLDEYPMSDTSDSSNSHEPVTHDSAEKTMCEICGKAVKNIQLHMALHAEQPNFECQYCGKFFATSSRLMSHKRKHSDKMLWSCQHCCQGFENEKHLNQHMMIHTGEKPYACDICSKTFRLESQLNHHKKKHSIMKFSCKFCKQPFSNARILKRHEKDHNAVKPFVCKICGQAFRSTSCLWAHKYTHSGEKPYKCDLCNASFMCNGTFRRHILKAHDKGGTTSCDICGQKFSGTLAFAEHMKGHEKKDHPCDICTKRFKSQSELEQHVKKFKSKNPYTCAECGKSFHYKHCLSRHLLLHSGTPSVLIVNQNQCQVCRYIFDTQEDLQAHEQKHKHNEPIDCELCGKKFHTKGLALIHHAVHKRKKVRVVHPIKI